MKENKTPIDAGIFMGSDSDMEKMNPAKTTLEQFGTPYAARINSAHRTIDEIPIIMKRWIARGCRVFIAGAGGAAHLAGVIAAHTTLPVIGVPLSQKTATGINALDSLLSIVQMPAGVPVATVAIDGSENAALLAVQILALSDNKLTQQLNDFKALLILKTHEKAEKLKQAGWPD